MCAAALMALGTGAANASDGPVDAYFWFSYWVSIGRLDAAADRFAADAVVIVAPACPARAPCVGRDAIRERYLARIARFVKERPLIDQRLVGTTLYAHDERSYRNVVTGVVDARAGRYAFVLRGGLIASLTFGGDDATPAFESMARTGER